MKLFIPPQFRWIRAGRRVVLVHEALEATVGQLLLTAPHAGPPGGVPLAAGRGGAYRLTLDDGETIVFRSYRRGGLLAHFVRETYWTRPPRPFLELATTEEARRRGVPVPEALGARIDLLAAGCYRGALVTRFLHDTETLWGVFRRGQDAERRRQLSHGAGRAVRAMQDAGIYHPDLNLTNCIVRDEGEGVQVFVVDLDRAGTRRGALPAFQRHRMLRRLERSARKLDPHGEVLAAADLAALREACNAHG
jgi:hypothetical protein